MLCIYNRPMFACKEPKKVLIIGGGDGGVLREIVKHTSVTEIHQCEIDRQVSIITMHVCMCVYVA